MSSRSSLAFPDVAPKKKNPITEPRENAALPPAPTGGGITSASLHPHKGDNASSYARCGD